MAERLRKQALAYPETYEESPWGDRVVKVRGKIFLFCGAHEGALHISVKLPHSGREALAEPWARPTPYGLGKSGWVSCTLERRHKISLERLTAWIDESYRALAPKKLVAQLDGGGAGAPSRAAAVPRIKKRVLLLCHDRLRVERAARVLGERGVTLEATDDVAKVRARLDKLDAVIVDVGRAQDEGLKLAADIDESDLEIHLFIVGIRDAAAKKRAQSAATSADLFRAPPGDAAVADAIAAVLARH
jgi:predicted DNA-binding protein (MmcQ/YjbR family)